MPSDYEQITQKNTTRLGTDLGSRSGQLGDMYSDPTHFIYEILQNADDHGATEISFSLGKKQLVIEHNGAELFEEKHVKSISYFSRSGSKDDPEKTGRFGLGFKSVFAFTATPKINSGDEHFEIYHLYRLRAVQIPEGFDKTRTRITLPFDHKTEGSKYLEEQEKKRDRDQTISEIDSRWFLEKEHWKDADEAYKDIGGLLRNGLDETTLLFTENLRSLKWDVGSDSGSMERKDTHKNGGRHSKIESGTDTKEFKLFCKDISRADPKAARVEIAFGWKNNRLDVFDYPLHVLFPTTEETGLKFGLNSKSFYTTASRETINTSLKQNKMLRDELVKLAVQSLSKLQENGWLDMKALELLPNSGDEIGEFFEPFRSEIHEALMTEALVPTLGGGAEPASSCVRWSAVDLRDLLKGQQDLDFFLGAGWNWVDKYTTSKRINTILKDLEIDQLDWEWFRNILVKRFMFEDEKWNDGDAFEKWGKLDDLSGWGYMEDSSLREEVRRNREWIEQRPDRWLQELYLALGSAIENEAITWADNFPRIVRAIRGKEVIHVAPSVAYFPKRGGSGFVRVKDSILKGKSKEKKEAIKEALGDLGVQEIEEGNFIQNILDEQYSHDVDSWPKKEDHLVHMKRFIKALKNKKIDQKIFIEERFKYSSNLIYSIFRSGRNYISGNKLYVDSPVENTGLSAIHEHPECPESIKRQPLSNWYKGLDGFKEFATQMGIQYGVSLERTTIQYDHPAHAALTQTNNAGTPTGYGKRDTDYRLKGIADRVARNLLNLGKKEVSELIWNVMRETSPKERTSRFKWNRRHRLWTSLSSLMHLLKEESWVPTQDGSFKQPREVSQETLLRSFSLNKNDLNGWLKELDFGWTEEKIAELTQAETQKEQKRKSEAAETLGVTAEKADWLANMSDEDFEEVKQIKLERDNKKNRKKNKVESPGSNEEDENPQATPSDSEPPTPYKEQFPQGNNRSAKSPRDIELPDTGGSGPVTSGRREKVRKDIAEAIESEPDQDERTSIRPRKIREQLNPDTRQDLKELYGGKCQICDDTFTTVAGGNYFEAFVLVSITKGRYLDRPGNMIVACAKHHAMLLHGVWSWGFGGDLPEHILGLPTDGSEEVHLPIRLCGEDLEIRYKPEHLADLQELLKSGSESSSSDEGVSDEKPSME